jgi:tetratricopeptide (TPR) repeat protein
VFLDLIEHVADWSRDAPILLLCVARPELLELRSGWGGGKLNATTVLLEALSAADCELLISRLAGDAELSDDLRHRILRAADGNPLFIEEMLAMVDEGTSDGEVVVPPTIHALLQSRLDRLGPGERDMIGRGAVEGHVFHRGTVQELAPEPEKTDVSSHLLALVRKELIRPDQPTYPDDEAFRFRHLLIRDAAYDSLPKETRAELHERFAEWLGQHVALVEQDEIVGYHLERAYRNRAELDRADPRLDELGRRAALRLVGAAHGAERRGDVGAFCGLLQRAAELLPEGDPQRLDALFALSHPLNTIGRWDEALAGASELEASRDQRFRAYGHLAQTMVDVYSGRFDADRAEGRVAAARNVFADLGDDLGLAWTGFLAFWIEWMACRLAAAAAEALRAEAHAHKAGADLLATRIRGAWVLALGFGPAPVGEAIQAAQALLDGASSILDRAEAQRTIGKLRAMRGEIDEAREQVRRAIEGTREAGQLIEEAAYGMIAAFVETRAGAPAAAEYALRRSLAGLDRLGNLSFRGTMALQLADVLASRGEFEEAARWCAEARETLNDDDLTDVIAADSLEGFLAAVAGSHAEGERLSDRAAGLAATIDLYEAKSRAYEWRARTLALVGKPAEAREAAATALAIYEAKGDVPASAWARELLDSLPA